MKILPSEPNPTRLELSQEEVNLLSSALKYASLSATGKIYERLRNDFLLLESYRKSST